MDEVKTKNDRSPKQTQRGRRHSVPSLRPLASEKSLDMQKTTSNAPQEGLCVLQEADVVCELGESGNKAGKCFISKEIKKNCITIL